MTENAFCNEFRYRAFYLHFSSLQNTYSIRITLPQWSVITMIGTILKGISSCFIMCFCRSSVYSRTSIWTAKSWYSHFMEGGVGRTRWKLELRCSFGIHPLLSNSWFNFRLAKTYFSTNAKEPYVKSEWENVVQSMRFLVLWVVF